MRHIVYCPHSRLAARQPSDVMISVLPGPLKCCLAGLICIVHPTSCTTGCVHTDIIQRIFSQLAMHDSITLIEEAILTFRHHSICALKAKVNCRKSHCELCISKVLNQIKTEIVILNTKISQLGRFQRLNGFTTSTSQCIPLMPVRSDRQETEHVDQRETDI